MIIFNLKLNKTSILKYLLVIMAIVCISIGFISVYKLVNSANKKQEFIDENTCLPNTNIAVIDSNNYTNILKEVHEDIDTYVGQKISFIGYIFKIDSFKDNQFVLARNMDIGNNQTLIVGFLCEYNDIDKFSEYSWVEITGEISKGTYNNSDIPIIKISDISQTQEPVNPTVPMPNNEFVPTSIIY